MPASQRSVGSVGHHSLGQIGRRSCILNCKIGEADEGGGMVDRFISRAFSGRRQQTDVPGRVPPGQHVVRDFPVLSAGPTPHTPLDRWTLTIDGLVRRPTTWTWDDFLKLPAQPFAVDIHCVTKWSKLDTHWTGVSIDTLFEHA